MIRSFSFTGLLIVGISTSLFAYSICLVPSSSPSFLSEAIAQQEEQQEQGSDVSDSSIQCPPNQHNVGSRNQCEWDNCGSASPPMYRNTQTGRCVSDCSEIGQNWVNQANVCVLGEASNVTSTQSPPTVSSISTKSNVSKSSLNQSEVSDELPSENATLSSASSNETSPPSTLTLAVGSLIGEPALPYACFSNTFACYCDGTQDCEKLTSSGECKAEVRTVEGKPGLGECDWNANS